MTRYRIPAVYMRGGTSKGLFFLAADLPGDPVERDRILLRVMGSPDRYGKQIDGMGGATSSTSKIVILSKSARADSDIDYLYGAVSIERPVIDWSANCGNLTAAVGPYAISAGLVEAPWQGMAKVRIWQANIHKRIIAHVPMSGGEVQEDGAFELDGVAFPAAEVVLEFLDPGADGTPSGANTNGLFPTGHRIDQIDVPQIGLVEATLINAGSPTIFIEAKALGLKGTELQGEVNGDAALLDRVEAIRAHGAMAMGLAPTAEEATARQPHSPKLAFIAEPKTYAASDGKIIKATSIDLLARTFSMGPLHHAMTGTGAVAIAAAASVPGTLVSGLAKAQNGVNLRFGHPSGIMSVGAEAHEVRGRWVVTKVRLSRSARRIMDGWIQVSIPQDKIP